MHCSTCSCKSLGENEEIQNKIAEKKFNFLYLWQNPAFFIYCKSCGSYYKVEVDIYKRDYSDCRIGKLVEPPNRNGRGLALDVLCLPTTKRFVFSHSIQDDIVIEIVEVNRKENSDE